VILSLVQIAASRLDSPPKGHTGGQLASADHGAQTHRNKTTSTDEKIDVKARNEDATSEARKILKEPKVDAKSTGKHGHAIEGKLHARASTAKKEQKTNSTKKHQKQTNKKTDKSIDADHLVQFIDEFNQFDAHGQKSHAAKNAPKPKAVKPTASRKQPRKNLKNTEIADISAREVAERRETNEKAVSDKHDSMKHGHKKHAHMKHAQMKKKLDAKANMSKRKSTIVPASSVNQTVDLVMGIIQSFNSSVIEMISSLASADGDFASVLTTILDSVEQASDDDDIDDDVKSFISWGTSLVSEANKSVQALTDSLLSEQDKIMDIIAEATEAISSVAADLNAALTEVAEKTAEAAQAASGLPVAALSTDVTTDYAGASLLETNSEKLEGRAAAGGYRASTFDQALSGKGGPTTTTTTTTTKVFQPACDALFESFEMANDTETSFSESLTMVNGTVSEVLSKILVAAADGLESLVSACEKQLEKVEGSSDDLTTKAVSAAQGALDALKDALDAATKKGGEMQKEVESKITDLQETSVATMLDPAADAADKICNGGIADTLHNVMSKINR